MYLDEELRDEIKEVEEDLKFIESNEKSTSFEKTISASLILLFGAIEEIADRLDNKV